MNIRKPAILLVLVLLTWVALPPATAFGSSAVPFHGFCVCSCTFRPDCNTAADCGGAACLHAVTCCATSK